MLNNKASSHIYWKLDIVNYANALDVFGVSSKLKIKRALNLLDKTSLKYRIDDVNEEYLDDFIVLYEKNILLKHNPILFDVKNHVLKGILNSNKRYKAVSLRDGDAYLGGMIFSHTDASNRISVAYKVFPKQTAYKLPANLSLLSDYFLYTYAIENNVETLLHGKDRNFYGEKGSSIGLAMYKLTAGALPFVSSSSEIIDFKSLDTFRTDTLMFLGSKPNEQIRSCILYLEGESPEKLKKYEILLENKNFLCQKVVLK